MNSNSCAMADRRFGRAQVAAVPPIRCLLSTAKCQTPLSDECSDPAANVGTSSTTPLRTLYRWQFGMVCHSVVTPNGCRGDFGSSGW